MLIFFQNDAWQNNVFKDEFSSEDPWKYFFFFYSSVIRQKGQSQNEWLRVLRVRIKGWEMFVVQKIWRAFFSCNTRFEICKLIWITLQKRWSFPWRVCSHLLKKILNGILNFFCSIKCCNCFEVLSKVSLKTILFEF